MVYDPKGDHEAQLPNMSVAYTADDVIRRLPGHVLYRPSLEDRSRRRPGDAATFGQAIAAHPLWCRWDGIMSKLLELGRGRVCASMVVAHELADLGSPVTYGPAFGEAIRQGRSLGITLVLVTQRPQGTPVIARSEAQHVAAFTLTDRAARDEAAALLADIEHPEAEDSIRQRTLPLDHTWWYRGPDFRLRLVRPLPYGAG